VTKKARMVPVPVAILLAFGVISFALWLLRFSAGGCACSGSRVQRVQQDFSSLRSAIEFYRQTNGELPSQSQGFQALVDRPVDGAPKNWTKLMTDIPRNPWNQPYFYLRDDRYPGGFGIYSVGKDGVSRSAGNDKGDYATWRQ